MSISVIDNIRKRLGSAADGLRPDVAPAKPRVPLKVRAAKTSAALSHVAILGLGAIAMHTRPDLVTALMKPVATVKATTAPIQTAHAATTFPNAKRVPLQTLPVISAPTTPPAIALTPSPTVAAAATVSPVKRTAPPESLAKVTTPSSGETTTRQTAPTETQLQTLPLTIARAVALPEARLVLAAAPPAALLHALPMTTRPRDIIRDARRIRFVKVREREVTALAVAATAATASAPTAAVPAAAPEGPPLVKWAALTPEQRAEANAPVKKSVPYTVSNVWTDEQIADGRAACAKILKSPDIVATDAEPVKEGACGAPAPVNVTGIGKPKVQLHPSSMMTCPMVAALDKWMTDKVQPAAVETFGAPVARLLSASSYSCRNRYGSANTPLSEHALVNALDLAGFVLADGRTVRVKQDWGPVARDAKKPVETSEAKPPESKDAPVKVEIALAKPPGKLGLSMLGGKSIATSAKHEPATDDKTKAANDDKPMAADQDAAKKDDKAATPAAPPAKDQTVLRREFLHRVHDDACDVFGTVLGPEANDAHRDHFHLDMKARRHKAFCQ